MVSICDVYQPSESKVSIQLLLLNGTQVSNRPSINEIVSHLSSIVFRENGSGLPIPIVEVLHSSRFEVELWLADWILLAHVPTNGSASSCL